MRRRAPRGLALAAALAGSALCLLGAEARAQTTEVEFLKVNQNAEVVGTLGAGSLATLNLFATGKVHLVGTIALGDPLDGTTLTVHGSSTFNEPVTINSTLATGGKATLDSLEVTKDASVKGALTVDGLATFKGSAKVEGGLAVDMIAADSVAAGTVGAGSISATTGTFATLTTTGKTTLDTLEVSKDAAVKGSLTVEKDAAVKGSLTVEKDAAVKGSLTVEKDATVKGGLTVEKDAAVKGKLTVENDTEVKGALTVAKGATVSESFTITPGSLISMGGNRVQDVADPLLDTDAANKRYVDAGLAAVNTKLASAFREIDKNSQGIAIAMAMSGLALPSDKNFALGVNMGFFDDKQALALQAAIRVNPFVTITGGFGTGVQDVGTVGGRVGMQVAW